MFMRGSRKVSARYFVLLCDWLKGQGTDPEALLRMAGIDVAKMHHPQAQLEPGEVDAFIGSAHRLVGRGDLGFELGRLINMTSHDLLGYGMLGCRNFDEMLRLVARHYHLMTETFTLRYQSGPDGTGEAIYTPALTMPLQTLHFYLEALAVAHDNQLRQMLPYGMRGTWDIYVSMSAPEHLARYSALPQVRFHFDEAFPPGVRVMMPASVLEHPLPFTNPRMVKEIDRLCANQAHRPRRASEDWVAYLRMVFRYVEGETPTLESIAENNCVSPRTIERYLRQENVSFRELLHQARFERACELLRNPLVTVGDVSQRLGFTDAANFSRAFRRVIGTTPTAYRQRAQASGCE
jgi:AraC-like DNA-binding protein